MIKAEDDLKLDAVLDVLRDGKWHSLNELSAYPSLKDLTFTKLIQLVEFFADYDFVELRPTFEDDLPITEARLSLPFRNFLPEIMRIESQA
jgi:hypothetical protein